MRKIKHRRKRRKRRKREVSRLMAVDEATIQVGLPNGRLELIQQLIPLGLEAVNNELQAEITRLVGATSYQRTETKLSRCGSNPGSVVLGGQKVTIEVPRVRETDQGREVPLQSYQQLRQSEGFDERVFSQLINGLSAKRYERATELVPETFGIAKSK